MGSELKQRKKANEDDIPMVLREERGRAVRVPSVFHKLKPKRNDITMAEVAKHHSRDDAWICVEGRAYDVTKYVEHHPGGWLPMANLAGKDVTDVFANYHPASVYEKQLPHHYIGDIIDYKVSDFVKEHRELRQRLLAENMFETSRLYYAGLMSWCAALFFTALYLTIARSTFWEHMLGAVCFGVYFQQIAFFGHDVGHNAITHVRGFDSVLGCIVGTSTCGISLAWWKRSHNVHHVVCNSIENDPDIQHLPAIAVDKNIFSAPTWWSTYHSKTMGVDSLARFLVSYQHWTFFPFMALARFNLYVQSWVLLLSKEKIDNWGLEMFGLAFFDLWFSIMVMTCIGTWQERLAFLLLSHGLAGVLHVQICLSHFAEATYHGQAYNNTDDEWFRMQVRTTLNVDCPEYLDWFHGGLQFQIEHHLFPRLPRHNLRYCRKLVKDLCKKHDIEYNELPWIPAIVRMVSKLKETALVARKLTRTDGGFYHSQFFAGLNASG